VSLLTKRLYRKESGRDASSTLSLVRKWGPSTRNIICSIDYMAEGQLDPIYSEARGAAANLCSNPSTITVAFHGNFLPTTTRSSAIFLRHRVGSHLLGVDTCSYFIPTPHLIEIFEDARLDPQNENSLLLFAALSPHSLTRAAAGWAMKPGCTDTLVRMGRLSASFKRGVSQ